MQIQAFDSYPILSALTENREILRKERGEKGSKEGIRKGKKEWEKRKGVKEERHESQNWR